MKHGISDEEWQDYLDGRGTAEARDRIEAHLTECLSCWEFYEQMLSATQALSEASKEARRHLTLTESSVHRMWQGALAQLQIEQAQAAQSQVRGRLETLVKVLAPFCGTQAATRALQAAAKHSTARSLEQVTHDNWEPFLERLTAIAAAMCGDTFAVLVRERGQL